MVEAVGVSSSGPCFCFSVKPWSVIWLKLKLLPFSYASARTIIDHAQACAFASPSCTGSGLRAHAFAFGYVSPHAHVLLRFEIMLEHADEPLHELDLGMTKNQKTQL